MGQSTSSEDQQQPNGFNYQPSTPILFKDFEEMMQETFNKEEMSKIDHEEIEFIFAQNETAIIKAQGILHALENQGVFKHHGKLAQVLKMLIVLLQIEIPPQYRKVLDSAMSQTEKRIQLLLEDRRHMNEMIDKFMENAKKCQTELERNRKDTDSLKKENNIINHKLKAFTESSNVQLKRKEEEIQKLKKETCRLEKEIIKMKTVNSVNNTGESKKSLKEELKKSRHRASKLEEEMAKMTEAMKSMKTENETLHIQLNVNEEKFESFRHEAELENRKKQIRKTEEEERNAEKEMKENTVKRQLTKYLNTIWVLLVRMEHSKCFNFVKMVIMLTESQENIEIDETKKKLEKVRNSLGSSEVEIIEKDIKESEKEKEAFEVQLKEIIQEISTNPHFFMPKNAPTHAKYLPVVREELQHSLEINIQKN